MDTLVLVLPYTYIPKSFFYEGRHKWIKCTSNTEKFSLMYGNVHLEYLLEYNCLKLSVSITKFLYGANYNVVNPNDLNKFSLEINFILKTVFSKLKDKFKYTNLANIKEWILNRIDLSANFLCYDDFTKNIYLDIFKQIKFPYLKKKNYNSGIHDGNKSVTLNFYDKNAEIDFRNNTINPSDDNIVILDKNLLRLEIQFKKNGINSLLKKGYLYSNKLKDLFDNLDKLNTVFFDYLNKLGLLKEFLSENEMDVFLLNLLKTQKITRLEYKNIKATLIDKTKCVCKNTLTKYIKLLSQYNYSNIVLKNPIENKLNFSNFELFKCDQSKKFYDQKLQILIYLYLLNLFIKKLTNRPLKKIIPNLIRPIKLIIMFDDS